MSRPRRLRRAALIGLVAATVLGAGCSKGGGRPEVAATVEGTRVTSAETEAIVEAYLRRQQVEPTGEDIPRDQVAKWVLDYQIKLTFLEHLAGTLGVSSEPESYFGAAADLIRPEGYTSIGQRREDFARELRAGRLSQAMARKLHPDVSISDTALAAEYERRGPLLDRNWKGTAQIARFSAEEAAAQVRGRVQQGETFADAARALGADDVSTVDINPVVAPLPAAVLDAVGQLSPGGVSEPLPAAGWVVVRLEQRQTVPRLTLDDLRTELTEFLAERERHGLFQEWFQKKFAEAAVDVDSYYGKWDAELTMVE
ncbi:MAG TPA: peptidylprolyl isomerase [Acidimicrobiia bacterium]|nr:peptidylprolyl isomerase [Acidimicrobiia bacterium]